MNKRERIALAKNFKSIERCDPFPPTNGRDIISIAMLPQEQQYQRTFDFIAVLNLVAALVLASMAGSALNLVDIAEIDEEKSFYGTKHIVLAEVFNIVIQVVVAMNFSVVVYTTYYLLLLASETSGTILRTIARSGGTVLWQYSVAVSLYGIVLSMNLMAILRMRQEAALVSITTTIVVTIFFQVHFIRLLVNAFPSKGIAWITGFGPYEFLLNGARLMRDAKRVARTQLTEAAAHLGPGYKPILDDQIVGKEENEEGELEFRTSQIGPTDGDGDGDDTESHNKLVNF
jgi:hypothetical protein